MLDLESSIADQLVVLQRLSLGRLILGTDNIFC